MKLAILTSHPIQYQAPFFRTLARQSGLDIQVYFCWDFGVKKTYDPQFGIAIEWDIPLLEGYNFKFLRNYSPKPTSAVWYGEINPGIVREIYTKQYDAILIYGWNRPTHWLAFITAFITKTSVFLHSENAMCQEFLNPLFKRKVKKIVLGWLFKHISVFLYIGEENKKFYKYYNVPDAKLFFCPYAVDNNRFIAAHKELGIKNYELRKELGIKKDDVVVLFVGKLIEKKRPMDLLKAYELLITAMRNTPMRPNIANEERIIMRSTRMDANTANNKDGKIIEKELSYVLNGIFFEIHNELGRFSRERQYADVLEKKLNEKSIKFKREYKIQVVGKKSNIADFIIEDRILVELKRKPTNTGDDYRQVKRYLESVNLKLGLLVNFGSEYLKPKRILNSKFIDSNQENHHTEYVDARKYNESDSQIYSSNSHYGIHLIFVGSGNLEAELKKYAERLNFKRVYSPNSHTFVNSHYGIHYVGFKNQTELPKYYALADIFVLPSGRGETWGLVVNEAMCFSVPVIVSDVVGCGSDLVKHNENGFIFPVGNISMLTQCLNDLVNDASKRAVFGRKSFEIIQNYNYQKGIKGIIKALNKK